MRSKVIILNGTSSAGKTSLARALQGVTIEPFLHVKMDAFLEMMPPKYADHPDALTFLRVEGADPPEVEILTGPYAARVLRGMRSAIVALAKDGLNIIVDDVFLEKEQAEYDRLLADYDVSFVRVDAALEVAEQREVARGDRDIGQARWQFSRVHQNVRYDFRVDTTDTAPDACARSIAAALNL